MVVKVGVFTHTPNVALPILLLRFYNFPIMVSIVWEYVYVDRKIRLIRIQLKEREIGIFFCIDMINILFIYAKPSNRNDQPLAA